MLSHRGKHAPPPYDDLLLLLLSLLFFRALINRMAPLRPFGWGSSWLGRQILIPSNQEQRLILSVADGMDNGMLLTWFVTQPYTQGFNGWAEV